MGYRTRRSRRDNKGPRNQGREMGNNNIHNPVQTGRHLPQSTTAKVVPSGLPKSTLGCQHCVGGGVGWVCICRIRPGRVLLQNRRLVRLLYLENSNIVTASFEHNRIVPLKIAHPIWFDSPIGTKLSFYGLSELKC